jgi:RNA polymerase sigma-70 factor (ECF subfamily)
MFRQTERRVLGYALRRAPRETAEDAVAEAYLAAWRRFHELRGDPLPWLVAATRRTLANQRRSASRQGFLVERLAHESSPAEADPSDLDGGHVAAAFRQLVPADREVLALVAWDGLNATQAAASLGCTRVGFRVRLHRARRRFARQLDEQDAATSRGTLGDAHAPVAKEVAP